MKCYLIKLIVDGDSKGFRFEILERAMKSGILGYAVRTGPDGFLIVAQSEEPHLSQFIEWLDAGFHFTKILKGTMNEIPPENFSTFELRSRSPHIQAREEFYEPEHEELEQPVSRSGWFSKVKSLFGS